jgi:hypothetical protein
MQSGGIAANAVGADAWMLVTGAAVLWLWLCYFLNVARGQGTRA